MKRTTPITWLAVAVAVSLAMAQRAPAGEHLKTESRTPQFHHIPIKDAGGLQIQLPKPSTQPAKGGDARAVPFSINGTCAQCHNYDLISKGWHFNANRPGVSAGRPGEPWILTDAYTHTQIPLSYRGWTGTYKPAEVGDKGMTDFEFVQQFARHMPGGGAGEPADPTGKWKTSGAMEADCLICHDGGGHYNHDARYADTLKGGSPKFKFSPSVAWGLGKAPLSGAMIDYDRRQFDAENKVSFRATRRAPAGNCYYCHTTNTSIAQERWHGDSDVHLRAGMLCVDCHRNGEDHQIVRGYEGETANRAVTEEMIKSRMLQVKRENLSLDDKQAHDEAERQLKTEQPSVAALSCRGCHMGEETGSITMTAGGRLGAPRAEHKGLPPLHLEKLSCTACHSGSYPTKDAQIVQTSLAHALGLPQQLRTDNTPPGIVQPVFLRGKDGKITPHRMVWPAYWGRMDKDGKVRPMLPKDVASVISEKQTIPEQTDEQIARDPYNAKPLTDDQIQKTLAALVDSEKAQPVFVASGNLYRIADGKLAIDKDHIAAKPYAWALGHDVRPAGQSLGSTSCQDCHASDSPIYFGTVAALGPVDPAQAVKKGMWELRGDNKFLAQTFAFTFVFRPMLKYVSFGCVIIILAVLLYYALAGVGGLTARVRNRQVQSAAPVAGAVDLLRISVWGRLVYLVLAVATVALAATGIGWAFVITRAPMTGWVLMSHATFAPMFAVGLALVALSWADRCRFGCDRTRMRSSSKVLFWLAIMLGLVVILSGVVPMTPVFGNLHHGQHNLYLIHRYAAIALAASMLLHLLSLIRLK